MSSIFPEPSSPPPPSAAPAGKNRILLGIVIGLGVLIVLALGALIAGIVLGGNDDRHAPAPTVAVAANDKAPKPATIPLPAGYKLIDAQTQPGRLMVHLRNQTQDEIDIFDLTDGRILAKIRTDAPPAATP